MIIGAANLRGLADVLVLGAVNVSDGNIAVTLHSGGELSPGGSKALAVTYRSDGILSS
jgi:hypothetical protein